MKSSELARMAGVSVRTLRHYHAVGLLPEPPRGENGYRDYEPAHLLRLLRIRQAASLGFSLEQIGPMLQDLDAERAEDDDHRSDSDRLLDGLDRQLREQIAQLERQRELIVRIRACQGDPDYPARAVRALKSIEDFERTSREQGFLLCALADNDRTAMGVAAHLFSEEELAEIERIFHAIPARGLTEEYLHVSRLMDSLPARASPNEHEAAIEAGLAFLEKIGDCFDARNWLRPDKDYEFLLESMASAHYNDAQIAASDELLMRFTQRMAERAKCDDAQFRSSTGAVREAPGPPSHVEPDSGPSRRTDGPS